MIVPLNPFVWEGIWGRIYKDSEAGEELFAVISTKWWKISDEGEICGALIPLALTAWGPSKGLKAGTTDTISQPRRGAHTVKIFFSLLCWKPPDILHEAKSVPRSVVEHISTVADRKERGEERKAKREAAENPRENHSPSEKRLQSSPLSSCVCFMAA
jgi:hypothetical protein